MLTAIRTSLLFLLVKTLITGVIYPVAVTAIGQAFFKYQANGSLIVRDGKIIGSGLIGQQFTGRGYFYSRPSSAGDKGYDASTSGASNLAISNNELVFQVNQNIDRVRRSSNSRKRQVPVDLVEGSGSGLDPHISIAAAYYQIPRIALERKITGEKVRELIDGNTEKRLLGVFGEDRVNVLRLNMALDEMAKKR